MSYCSLQLTYYFLSDVADDPQAYQQPEEDDDIVSSNDDSKDEFTRALDLLVQQRREKEADGMNSVFREIEEQKKVTNTAYSTFSHELNGG